MKLKVAYRDPALVVVDKPAGVVVHPQEDLIARKRAGLPLGESDLERNLMQMVRDELGTYVYPVHRLDRGTSGIVLFALDQNSARNLCQQFYSGSVEKTYVAWVRGWTARGAEAADSPYAASEFFEISEPVKPGPRAGFERISARTLYRTLARYELPARVGRYATARSSIVEVHPQTGRYHQIRTHLRSINHPILGDHQHGDRDHNRFAAEWCENHLGAVTQRLWLRCSEIEIFHPLTGRKLRVDAGWNPDWRALLQHLPATLAAPTAGVFREDTVLLPLGTPPPGGPPVEGSDGVPSMPSALGSH